MKGRKIEEIGVSFRGVVYAQYCGYMGVIYALEIYQSYTPLR